MQLSGHNDLTARKQYVQLCVENRRSDVRCALKMFSGESACLTCSNKCNTDSFYFIKVITDMLINNKMLIF